MRNLDTKAYLKRVALAVCFVIKLFGGNLFEIVCNNQTFAKICKYADEHMWATYLIYIPYSFISLYFFVLAIMQKTRYTKLQFYICLATVLVGTAIKLISPIVGFVFDFWQFVIMPAIFTLDKRKKHWNILIANILLIVFQLVSMFVKNIDFGILTTEGALISIMFSLDVRLMLILYFAYSNLLQRKEGK